MSRARKSRRTTGKKKPVKSKATPKKKPTSVKKLARSSKKRPASKNDRASQAFKVLAKAMQKKEVQE